ncbi:Por secretion system C-terminal sorting domain-containing protein [Formosa sp. Hel1_31_208]|uniref:T9SS type A sorting domain-containing protein n=1 Tax=Formosa sp. Hel1_31_208 TaxID=1798225 RepID=UPI00087D2A01|nr:T9SS type A sorting domain-containing protein [Formosa sp. Hel1_31_208]SDR92680.1 Por secretion system C-terminal sorting domain-containing protein [Formosa sp. Hel1_31_208]
MIKKYTLLFFLLPLFIQAQTIEFESAITPDLSGYTGVPEFAGLGEYEIFLDTDTGVLDKPIILVDGFDPGDGRTISGLYNLLDFTGSEGQQNLADLVRAQGFDVVILNFPSYFRLTDNSLLNIDDATDNNADLVIDELDYPGSTLVDGGADFMERNAMLLVDLITTLNTDKVGDEELVIIGPSMGGLISRFALNYMENQTLDHETRLFISFDSPHLGANIPLGFQHQFNFLANGLGNDLNITALQPIVNGLLKSAAARQLLVDHFEAHLVSGSDAEFDPTKLLPEAHPYRAVFENNINSLTATGFPQNTRNVSMINGSGIGSPYLAIDNTPVTPGFVALAVQDLPIPTSPLPQTTADININLTPATVDGPQLISKIFVEGFFLFGFITLVDVEVQAEAPSFSDGVDAASGGLFNLSGFTAGLGGDPIIDSFLTSLTIDKFNFIPSVSAMALDSNPVGENDWFHDIDLGTPEGTGDTLNSTPFVNWYMPDDNEDHVQLTEQNVAFALSEIIPETLSNIEFENITSLKIEKNPIEDNLTILSNKVVDGVTITAFDITGKSVFVSQQTLERRTTLPLNLETGLYILNIQTKDNYNYRTKVVVK